jgi:transposase
LLIEAAWHYRKQPRISLALRARQAGQPPAAIDAAWRAQLRLHRRWAHLDGLRGKRRTTVAVAVARRAGLLCLGDRPTTRLTPAFDPV